MTISDLAAKVMQMREDAINAKIAELVSTGYSMDEIALETMPNGDVRMIARRVYVAEYKVTVPDA